MAYLRPERLEDAIAALAHGGAVPLAGGTDFYPARVLHMPDERVLDLSAIASLRGIS
ncbi:MAG: FAD binding domain-containing protein, partial [Acetobacteraceae bacterium]|nr:FAD binding domain-containing protein [Acetobacteraceae bacterium]